MKLKNKQMLYGLGSIVAIAPLPIIGMNLDTSKEVNRNDFHQTISAQFEKISTVVSANINNVVSIANKIFVGTNNGLWVSSDLGSTFTQVGGGLDNNIFITSTYQTSNGKIFVTISGSNPTSVNEENGLWVSNDGGNSFTQVVCQALKANWRILSIFQTSNGNIYLGTGDDGSGTATGHGLLMSIDGGNNFNQVGEGLASNLIVHSVFQSSNGKIFIGTENGLWMSNNEGKNFTKQANIGNLWTTSTYQTKNGNIYVAAKGLWMSKDGGNNFNLVNFDASKDWFINSIYQTSDGRIFVSIGDDGSGKNDHGLWVSPDGETNFTQVSNGIGTDWNIGSVYQLSNRRMFVATLGNGLWISTKAGINLSFQQGANHIDSIINGEINTISNQKITVTISDPAVKVNLDGIDYDVTSSTPFSQDIDPVKMSTPHKFIITYTDNNQYSFMVWAKGSLNINDNNFTVDSGYTLHQYQGYLLGDESKPVQVKSVTGALNKPALHIVLSSSDSLIYYSKSNYQQVDSSFAPMGNPTSLDSKETIMNLNGMYLLTIVDYIGNTMSYYVQIGGTNDAIPTTPNGDFVPFKPSSLIPTPTPPNSSKFATWKIIVIVISAVIGIGLIALAAVITLRKKKVKS